MARIRSAKPEFWTDPKMTALPRDVRFTFKGLWEVCADDEGRFLSDARMIKGQVWPVDDDITPKKIERWLQLLSSLGRIALYDVAGARYGVLTHWHRHQKISHPRPSKLPPPPDNDQSGAREIANDSGAPPKDSGNPPEKFRPDVDLDVDLDKDLPPQPPPRARAKEQAELVRDALPDAYRRDLDKAIADSDRPAALVAELHAMSNAELGRGAAFDWATIALGLHDYVANGRHKRFNARQLRRYVEGATVAATSRMITSGPAYSAPSSAGALFDGLLDFLQETPGGWRELGRDFYDALEPAVRSGLSSIGGPKAIANADEVGLRVLRKNFCAAYDAAHAGTA